MGEVSHNATKKSGGKLMKKFFIWALVLLMSFLLVTDFNDINAATKRKKTKRTNIKRTYKPLPAVSVEITDPVYSAQEQESLKQILLPTSNGDLVKTENITVSNNNNLNNKPLEIISATPPVNTAPEPMKSVEPAVSEPIKPVNNTSSPAIEEKKVNNTDELLIADFKSGTYTKDPEFWKFDRINLTVVDNDPKDITTYKLGNKSLLVEGSTINWYIGGFGTYLGKEITNYDTLELMVYGNGSGSGVLKIELYDDDNNNWVVDVNPVKSWDPTKDDKFSYSLNVDWTGWKLVEIPLSDFLDENPEVGDNIWNPDHKKGSGGLLTMQIVCLSGSGKAVGKMDLKIEHIKFRKMY